MKLFRPFSHHLARVMTAFSLTLGGVCFAQSFPEQGAERAPQFTPEGILFECFAPAATAVFIAGDFNGWAENQDGTITSEQYKLDGPNDQGIFRKVVKVEPGAHKMKFSLEGKSEQWFAPDWAQETDAEGNAVFYVTQAGMPLLRNDVNSEWAPAVSNGVATFKVYRPKADSVHLAGSFNNWGNNNGGTVSDPAFAMQGPGDQGLWTAEIPLGTGRHAYKFVINGTQWEADPNAPDRDDEGHSILNIP